jgi:hypothetical protein
MADEPRLLVIVPGLGAEYPAIRQPIRRLVTDAGFTRFRRATETPFNIVYEARR